MKNNQLTKIKFPIVSVLCGLILSLTLNVAQAAYPSWINTGTGDWNNAANWDTGTVPTYNDITYLQNTGTAILNGGGSANSLYVGGASPGTLIINSSASLNTSLSHIESDEGSAVIVNGGYWYSSTLSVGYGGSSNSNYNVLEINGGTVASSSFWLTRDNAGAKGMLVIAGDGSGQLNATINGGAGQGVVSFAHSGNRQFANTISGANITIASSSGTTTLTASNVVKNLNVSGGKLNVSGTLTLQGGQSTVTGGELNVVAGGVLGGSGNIGGGGVLTVESGGTLLTTLILGEGTSLTLEAGSILGYLDSSTLYADGGIIVNGGVFVDFSGVTLEAGDTYYILERGSGPAVNVGDFTAIGLGDGLEGSFGTQGKVLTFNVSAVPEPSTYFLMGIGLGLVGLLKLRRQRQQG
jgi:hypothetical protein